MRCIPTALARSSAVVRADESARISAITHDDADCQAACVAYNEMASTLVLGQGPTSALDAALQTEPPPDVADALEYGQRIDLHQARSDAKEGGPGPTRKGAVGWVCDSLALAVAAMVSPAGAEESLVYVVNLGGDADTNGAIAGGLLGARDGASAFPARWTSVLQLAGALTKAAPTLLGLRGPTTVDGS